MAAADTCNNWSDGLTQGGGVWGDGRQPHGAATWTAVPTLGSCASQINLLCIEQ